MIYEIAGLKVEMNPKFDRLKRQSEAYKSLGEPVIRINPDFDGELYTLPDNCSAEDREYIYSSAAFCREIIPHGDFFSMLRGGVGRRGISFSAPSGMGKSTHTALWLRSFEGSYILRR